MAARAPTARATRRDPARGMLRLLPLAPMLLLLLLAATLTGLTRPALASRGARDNDTTTAKAGASELTATQVYLVPHSHDDLGWLRTVDEYYEEYVRYSLDSIVTSLTANRNRTFVQAETGFFARWWADADDAKRAAVKALVRNGQLEMVNGGWVMADEAVTTFEGVVNQLTLGHRFLETELGVRPRVAWHIDPFGASATFPAMFADMGYDAFVINRIDYSLKQQWQITKGLEFVWRGTPSRGTGADMFTHVLDSHYSAPYGFDWEYFTAASQSDASGLADSAPPVHSTAPSPFAPANIEDRASDLAEQLQSRAAMFRTPNLLVPFGDDFKMVNSRVQFENMERLIEHINANVTKYKVRLRFATLSQYFDEVAASGTKWPLYTGDFFPYAYAPNGGRHDQPGWASANSYWSGFYASRSQLKGYSRAFEATVHATEVAMAGALASGAANVSSGSATDIKMLHAAASVTLPQCREVSGLLKHHDAEPGTARPYVVADYLNRIVTTTGEAEAAAATALDALAQVPALQAAAAAAASTVAETSNKATTAGKTTTQLPKQQQRQQEQKQQSSSIVGGPTALSSASPGAGLKAACSGATVPVMLWNPLAHARREVVALPSPCAQLAVTTSDAGSGKQVPVAAQVNPNTTMVVPIIPAAPGSADDTPPPFPPPPPANFTLYALVTLPPTGYATLFVTGGPAASGPGAAAVGKVAWDVQPASVGNITNGFVTVSFGTTGELVSIASAAGSSGGAGAAPGTSVQARQTFEAYTSNTQWPQSDVYVLRPDDSEESVSIFNNTGMKAPLIATVSGPLVNEVTQVYLPRVNATAYVQQTLRLYSDSQARARRAAGLVSAEGGGISVDEYVDTRLTAAMADYNVELVSVYATDIDGNVTAPKGSPAAGHSVPSFYTDANTQDIKHRVLVSPDWVADVPQVEFDEPVAANYYPAPSLALLRDQTSAQSRAAGAAAAAGAGGVVAAGDRQFGVVFDRSHGAASLHGGELEVMLHRRTNVGSDQTLPLDDRTVLEERGALFIGRVSDGSAALLTRTLQRRLAHPVTPFYGSATMDAALWTATRVPTLSLLDAAGLPVNVALQSFDVADPAAASTKQSTAQTTVVLRLRHVYGAGEHPTLSAPVSVDVASLFNGNLTTFVSAKETTLNTVAPVNAPRLTWDVSEAGDHVGAEAEASVRAVEQLTGAANNTVVLGPLQTRTFMVTLQPAATTADASERATPEDLPTPAALSSTQ